MPHHADYNRHGELKRMVGYLLTAPARDFASDVHKGRDEESRDVVGGH